VPALSPTCWVVTPSRRSGSPATEVQCKPERQSSDLWGTMGCMSSLGDRRERREVGTALRKGQPIPPGENEVARTVIGDLRRNGWLRWSWLLLGCGWLYFAYLTHGSHRWANLVLAVLAFGVAFRQFRWRKQILSREGEFANLGSP